MNLNCILRIKRNMERRKAEVLIVSYLLGLVEFIVYWPKVTSLSWLFLYAYHSYYDKHFYSTLCSFRLGVRSAPACTIPGTWHCPLLVFLNSHSCKLSILNVPLFFPSRTLTNIRWFSENGMSVDSSQHGQMNDSSRDKWSW